MPLLICSVHHSELRCPVHIERQKHRQRETQLKKLGKIQVGAPHCGELWRSGHWMVLLSWTSYLFVLRVTESTTYSEIPVHTGNAHNVFHSTTSPLDARTLVSVVWFVVCRQPTLSHKNTSNEASTRLQNFERQPYKLTRKPQDKPHTCTGIALPCTQTLPHASLHTQKQCPRNLAPPTTLTRSNSQRHTIQLDP